MQRDALPQYYADNVGLIHIVTKKGYGRLTGMGSSYSYEDLFQDLSVVFIKAFDAFDDNAGFKFSTYFTSSAYRKLNKIAEKIQIERIEMKTRSTEEMAANMEDGDGETMDIACPCATPFDMAEATSAMRYLTDHLSPLAATMLAMATDPPEFIEREFAAAYAHAAYAREGGGSNRARMNLTVGFVCRVLEKVQPDAVMALRAARREIGLTAQRSFT